MKLSKEEVAHLAKLSRLDLPEQKLEQMTKDFGSILEYVDSIQKVDVEGVEPFTMPSKSQGWREDVAFEADEATRELILTNFPERAGDLLAAPGVFEVPKK
ncbi:MAG: Asp-tRNA(Asn)/Glu-tRNA(Gln) amidotransferase subunit GatC [Patescibacteria group bacterium]|jgi:aspartyl-tRNA(Asn)/glutamyl-tRNA(Gln) amidotransferase subunit C|nr:Asp-tRNA(Asn)/Glu-tRNA(Gln) amidotransferase subunit GatC [Patescibacteria group bacterium]